MTTPPTPRPLRNILVVDDERDIRAVARIALEAVGGFAVEECATGAEALARIVAAPPDLVLLDVMMPEMDGRTTLQRIRALPAGAPPVVVMTARVQPSETAEYRALGAVGVIAKPFDAVALPREVLRLWNGLAAPPPAAAPPPLDDEMEAIADRFRQALPRLAREIEDALAAGAGEPVRRIAHRVRGSGGTLGFAELAEAAGAVDDALRGGEPLERVRPQVARLSALLRRDTLRA